MMTNYALRSLLGPLLLLAMAPAARATGPSSAPSEAVEALAAPQAQTLDVVGGAELFPHERTLCGPFAVYLACRSYGIQQHTPTDLARMATFNGRVTSIEGLRQACDQIGLHAKAVHLNSSALEKLVSGERVRAIVLLKGGHFCYVDQAGGGRFRITVYPHKPQWYAASDLEQAWEGPALLMGREPLPDLAAAPTLASTGSWSTGRMIGIGMAGIAVLYLGYVSVKGKRGRAALAGVQSP